MTTPGIFDKYSEGLARLEKLVLTRDRFLDTLRSEASVAFSSLHHVCDIDPSKLRMMVDQIVELENQIRSVVREVNIFADASHKERVHLVARHGVRSDTPTTPLRTH